jgi:hypothetical protein
MCKFLVDIVVSNNCVELRLHQPTMPKVKLASKRTVIKSNYLHVRANILQHVSTKIVYKFLAEAISWPLKMLDRIRPRKVFLRCGFHCTVKCFVEDLRVDREWARVVGAEYAQGGPTCRSFVIRRPSSISCFVPASTSNGKRFFKCSFTS